MPPGFSIGSHFLQFDRFEHEDRLTMLEQLPYGN